jgi:hypothetical protein
MRAEVLLLVLVSLCAFMFSGCTPIMHDMIVNSNYLKFEEVFPNMPPVDADQSRIVVYYPRVAFAGVSINPLVPIGGLSCSTIDLQNKQGAGFFAVLDQTVEYMDIPAGTYTLKEAISKQTIDVNAEPAKTYYFKVQAYGGQLNYKPPVLVDEANAIAEIKKGKIRGVLHNPPMTIVPQNQYNLVTVNDQAIESDPNKMTKLYIIRKTGSVSCFQPIYIGLDSDTRYELNNNYHCVILVPPGRHVFTYSMKASCFGGHEYKWANLVRIKPGVTNYLTFKQIKYAVIGLTQPDSEQGLKDLKKTKLGKNGTLMPKL